MNNTDTHTEAFNWIKKVIASCTAPIHLQYCYTLAERYKEMFKDESGYMDLLIAIDTVEVTLFNF